MKTPKNTKRNLNFSIDIPLIEEFDKVADKKAINRSKLIENFIREWVEANK